MDVGLPLVTHVQPPAAGDSAALEFFGEHAPGNAAPQDMDNSREGCLIGSTRPATIMLGGSGGKGSMIVHNSSGTNRFTRKQVPTAVSCHRMQVTLGLGLLRLCYHAKLLHHP